MAEKETENFESFNVVSDFYLPLMETEQKYSSPILKRFRENERNYKKLYESLLKELNSKIQNDHTVFTEGISPICTAKLVRQLIGNSPIGPNVTIQNADVSSMQAIGEAFKAIQCGEIDLAITGGVQEYSLWTALNLEKYNLLTKMY